MIYLLDLNYTLVSNSDIKIQPFTAQIAHEQYRLDLIEKVETGHVILITARPELHRQRTLARIKAVTAWEPDEAYFNDKRLPPPAIKSHVLNHYILSKHGTDPKQYLAIESNPRTRTMYENYGIKAVTYEQFINEKES